MCRQEVDAELDEELERERKPCRTRNEPPRSRPPRPWPARRCCWPPPQPQAEVVDVNYQCKTPIGNKSAVSPIDIKGVKSGSGYKLTMSFQKGVSSSPVELGKGAMSPSATIKLGGADSGTVPVSGPANQAAIPANTPIKINDLTGTYTPKKTGKVTFTAGHPHHQGARHHDHLHAVQQPRPSLTLDVTAASGGSSGGTGQGGGAASDSGSGAGSVPPAASSRRPAPTDSAIALGTLGGTVLLAGAAGALWLTRRNQAARR